MKNLIQTHLRIKWTCGIDRRTYYQMLLCFQSLGEMNSSISRVFLSWPEFYGSLKLQNLSGMLPSGGGLFVVALAMLPLMEREIKS